MRRLFTGLMAAGVMMGAALAAPAFAAAPAAPTSAASSAKLPDIPYTRFTLPNGLTVVVSEDHKAPVVAVAVWYHVGSAREPAGKSGYAHLFEHLMFERSGHHEGEYFAPFEKVGAIGMNGTTDTDRTNYFETVPTSALDMALWMESDRMGWLLDGLKTDEVDQQRGVVQNEKRQGENQPLGIVGQDIEAHAYPENHPYHHDTIGSMKDLNAASLNDFRHWFKSYYGPNNATLVLVGDITPAQAKAKVKKYFGNIPPGPPVAKLKPWTFPRSKSTHSTIYRHVPQVHLFREWNTPAYRTHDDEMLDLAAWVLGGSKTSRLYQRLVYQDKLADNVSVDQRSAELGSGLWLNVDIKKGVDPSKGKAAVSDVWKKFLHEGPTADELERAKTTTRAGFVRRLERVGGFGGKAVLLASGQVYNDDPGAWRKSLENHMQATPDEVRAAARKWLSKGDYTLIVKPVPKGKQQTTADEDVAGGLGPAPNKPKPVAPAKPKTPLHAVKSDVDRSKGVPEVNEFPGLTFPNIQHATLDNGIKVTLARRKTVPLVEMSLQFDSGYASDQGHKLGRANFTMSMLQQGTRDLDSVDIAKRKQRLGANISTRCGLDACAATLSALADKLDPSLKLLSNVVQHPAFRDADIARIRGKWIAGIAQEKNRPVTMAVRVLPPLIYGKGYPYAMPLTGSGTTDSVKALTRDDMQRFMRDYIRPDNVRILVAGDIGMDQLVAKLNKVFGQWQKPDASMPQQKMSKVTPPDHDRVFLMNRPGALQSVIFAGVVAPSAKAPNRLAIQIMNGTFGGTFTSRLNMDLRQSKHWAYGAHSMIISTVGPGAFMMYAPVQTDKTAPSIKAMVEQAKAVVGDKPPSNEEIAKIKDQRIHALPGQYQTNGAVLGALESMALYDRPDDYVTTLKPRIKGLSDAAVHKAAKEVIQPGHFTWVIVGDLDKVGKSVRALDLGPVEVLDANGKPAKADSTGKPSQAGTISKPAPAASSR
jgi:predicted Zn-dependent peptidase